MALKPFWNKKYHLGMTGDEVKAALQGGGGGGGFPNVFTVLFTYDPDSEQYTADHTYEEIAALPYGTHIVFVTDLGIYFNVQKLLDETGIPFFSVIQFWNSDGTVNYLTKIFYYSDGSIVETIA